MNRLRRYLFCCNPRIGSIYAGFYSLISSAIFLGLLFMRFVGIELNPVESTKDQVVLSSTLAVFIMFMVSSSFLIVMAFKDRKNYFRPWMACALIAIVEGTAMLMWHIITERMDVGKVEHWEIIIIAYHSCNVVILAYCMTLVYSQFKVLKHAPRSPSHHQNEREAQPRNDVAHTSRINSDVISLEDFDGRHNDYIPPPYADKPPPYSVNNSDEESYDYDHDESGNDEDDSGDDDDDDDDTHRSIIREFSLGYLSTFTPQVTFIQTISSQIPFGIPPPGYDEIIRRNDTETDTIQTDSCQSDLTQTDIRQTDITQTSISETGAMQAEMTRVNMTHPEMTHAGMANTDVTLTSAGNAHTSSQRPRRINLVKMLLNAGILEESKV